MKKNTLLHTHYFGKDTSLLELVTHLEDFDFNLFFLKKPILFKFNKPVSGKIIYLITKKAVGETLFKLNNKEDEIKKYIGNHTFNYRLESSIYKILRNSIDKLYSKIGDVTDYWNNSFLEFEYHGCIQRLEIYSDNTIMVFFCEDDEMETEDDDFIDDIIEPKKYAVLYYGAPTREKGKAILELREKLLFDSKTGFKIESIYKIDRAIFSLKQNTKTQSVFLAARARAKKLGISITKMGKPYDDWWQDAFKNMNHEKRQDYLIIDESGENFKNLNVTEEMLAKVELGTKENYTSTQYDIDEHEFINDLLDLQNAPVSIFKKNKRISNFERHVKKLYDITLPIPFTGEVQISYNDPHTDEEYEQFDFDKTQEIKFIKSAKTIKNLLENALQYEDGFYWLNSVRYLGPGKLKIYLSWEENDYIKDNNKLYDKLLKDGYVIESLNNKRISFEKGEINFIVRADLFEPLIVTVSVFNSFEAKNPLTESQLRAEMLKFLPGLSVWNCIPALLNENCFTMVVDVFNAVDEDESKEGYDSAEEYAAMSLKFLHTQRRNITYKLLTNGNPVNQLVTTVNIHEKNVFGKTYFIKDAREIKNTLTQKPKGFGKYTFQDLNILTKANGMAIGNIILWKYEQIKDLVVIEYSIQKTSKELIMKIPFTKLTKGKKRN